MKSLSLNDEVIFSGKKNLLYKTWLGYLLSFIAFFILLYPVQLKGTPVTTRISVGAFCFVLVVAGIILISFLRENYFKKSILFLGATLALIALVALIAILVNNTRDFEYIIYPVRTALIILLAAYVAVFFLIKTHGYVSFNLISTYYIIAMTVQCIIGLTIYLNGDAAGFFGDVQAYNELDTITIAKSQDVRILGFGAQFMNAGVILGFGLMLLAVLVKRVKMSIWAMIGLGVVFGFNFIIGMMMARTTIIGAVLAVLFLLFPSSLKRTSLSNGAIFFIILSVLGVLFFFFGFPLMGQEMIGMFNYGFEMFINFAESGEFRTDSSDMVIAMYKWPDNFRGWVIGDARFAGEGLGYYMGTDIGYCRLIFYFGIIGFIAYAVYQLALVFMSFSLNKDKFMFRVFAGFCTVFYFVIMSKGIVEMTYLLGAFWIAANIFRKKYVTD